MNLQGKQHLSSQPSTIGIAFKGNGVKSQLANAILHGVGSARDMLMKRNVQAQSHMKVQKVRLLQQSQSVGESHPVPVQTLPAYKNCKRQSHRGA